MLTIRKAQEAVFREETERKFEDRLLAHLKQCFPERCKPLAEEALRSEIKRGVQRARSYGLATERDLCSYLNLIFVFGRDFDVDPRLPWASQILKAPEAGGKQTKMQRLRRAAGENAHQARGLLPPKAGA